MNNNILLTQKGIIVSVLVIIMIICAGSYLSYNNGRETGFRHGYKEGEVTGFNESFINTASKYLQSREIEMEQEYTDLEDITLNLDYRDISRKLFLATDFSNDSSRQYFSEALYVVHKEILNSLVDKAEIEPEIKNEILATYDSLHLEISVEHYITFKNKMEMSLTADPVFQRKAYTASQEFGSTVSESICGVFEVVGLIVAVSNPVGIAAAVTKKGAQHIGKKTIKSASVQSMVGGEIKGQINSGIMAVISPCTSLLNKVAPKLNISFREAGAYVDMQHLEITFGDYIRRSITEIATTEDVIKNIEVTKTVKRYFLEKHTSFFKKDWLASTAEVKINADARIKAGIDIAKFFSYSVFPEQKSIIISVAGPEIMSREIYSTIIEMEDGTLIDVDEDMLNDAENDIRIKLEQQLEKSEILKDAKVSFESFFEAIILPSIRYRGITDVSFQYLSDREITNYQSPQLLLKKD